jgi:glycosyltransferase involved in cell wall biosynthesis
MHLGLMYLGKASGIGHCTYHLAEVLSHQVEVTCYLATQNDMVRQFEGLPCRVRSFAMKRGYAALIAAMLTGREKSGIATAILEDSPDVLLDTGSWWWRGVVERGLRGQVLTAEMVHDVTPHPGLMGMLERIHHVVYPSVADAVISLSRHGHSELASKYPRKYHIESRLGLLLPSVESDPEKVASLSQRMLFFGRIEPYKGLDVLTEAFALAKQQNPSLELSVVGRGRLRPALASRMLELGIHLRNEYVSDDEAGRIIAGHGVLVLPYTSATQSGVAAVALANGLPCIATNVGALPEQVQDGVNGLVVPPGDPRSLADAMVRLSRDRRMARSMSEEALRLGREVYSWSSIARDLLNDLRRFLSERRSQ